MAVNLNSSFMNSKLMNLRQNKISIDLAFFLLKSHIFLMKLKFTKMSAKSDTTPVLLQLLACSTRIFRNNTEGVNDKDG